MSKVQSQKRKRLMSSPLSSPKRYGKQKINIIMLTAPRVKNPFVNNNIAIIYLPKPVTVRARSSVEIDLKLRINLPPDVQPEYGLLPSFKKYFILHNIVNDFNNTENLKIKLLNRSFCDCLRLPKDTGIIYFIALNKCYDIMYSNKKLK